MRMLLDVKIPHETFNAAVRDGSAGEKLKRILEATTEAVYFTERDGQRGAIMIVNLDDPSKIPTLAAAAPGERRTPRKWTCMSQDENTAE